MSPLNLNFNLQACLLSASSHLVVVLRVVVHARGPEAGRALPPVPADVDWQRRRAQRGHPGGGRRRPGPQPRGGIRVRPTPRRLQRPGAVHPVPLGGARTSEEDAVLALKKIRMDIVMRFLAEKYDVTISPLDFPRGHIRYLLLALRHSYDTYC